MILLYIIDLNYKNIILLHINITFFIIIIAKTIMIKENYNKTLIFLIERFVIIYLYVIS